MNSELSVFRVVMEKVQEKASTKMSDILKKVEANEELDVEEILTLFALNFWEFNKSSQDSSRATIKLSYAVAFLTAVIAAAAVLQIFF